MTPFDDKHQLLDTLIGKVQRSPSPGRTIYRDKPQFMNVTIDGRKRRMACVIEYFGGPLPNRYTGLDVAFYVPQLFRVKVRWNSSFAPLSKEDLDSGYMWRRFPIKGPDDLPLRVPDQMRISEFCRFNNSSNEEIEHYLTIAVLSGEME